MAARELAVVVEHGPLQFKPLLEEGQRLDLALGLVAASVAVNNRGNILYYPNIGASGNLLVAIDLLLFVTPFGEGLGVRPHGNLARVVDKLEIARHGLEDLVLLAMLNSNLKQRVILTLSEGILNGHGRELLVRRIVWGRNVMRQEDLVGAQVLEADEIVVLDIPPQLLVIIDGQDLPVIVGVVERVAGDLLTLARDSAVIISQGVVIVMAVEVGLCLLVPDGQGIVILDINRVGQHDIVAQGLLKFGSHEVIARAGSAENSEVHLEPEEVKDKRQDDEAEGACSEMLAKLGEAEGSLGSLNIQQVPKVDDDGGANGDEGEKAHVLGRDVAGQGKASQDEPLPPLPAERLMAKLVEFDVEEQTAGHGQDEGRIEQDEAGLANMGVVEEHKRGGNNAGGQAIPRFPHDEVSHRHGQGSQNGRQCAERDIGDLVVNIGVANVVEVEMAIVAHKPAHEGEEELGKRRVHIEEVGPLEVVGGKLQGQRVSRLLNGSRNMLG